MSFTVQRLITILRRLPGFTSTEFDGLADRFSLESGDSSTLPLIQELSRAGQISAFQAKRLSEGKDIFFGDYEIVDQVGESIVANSYKARDTNTGQRLLLRIFRDELFEDDPSGAWFDKCVEPALYVTHQNIAQAFDSGIRFGKRFLASELIDGENVAQSDDWNSANIESTLLLVRRIAQGLEHAHDQSVFHGNVSPRNIIIDAENRVSIVDFGVGQLSVQSLFVENEPNKLAPQNAFEYLSPEQFSDPARVDESIDIYSLGCTLHFMLTGKPVFRGRTAADKRRGHLEDTPSDLQSIREDIPAEVNDLFQRMVAKRPKHRIESMFEVMECLDQILEKLQVADRPQPLSESSIQQQNQRKRKKRWRRVFRVFQGPWVLILLTIALMTGLLGLDWFNSGPTPDLEIVDRADERPVFEKRIVPSNQPTSPAATSTQPVSTVPLEILTFAIEKRLDAQQTNFLNPHIGTISRIGQGDVVIAEDELISASKAQLALLSNYVQQGQEIRVTELDLSQTSIRNIDLELISELNELTSLSLRLCDGISDEGIGYLRKLGQLEAIDLRGTLITTSGLHHLPSSPLRSIMLDAVRDQMGGDLIETLASRYDESLTSLGIDHVVLDESEFQSISRLKNLRDLRLTFVGMPTRWLEHIAPLNDLTTLDLTGNADIDDFSLDHFKAIDQLERLTLNQTSVKDQGRFEAALACTIVWEE